ncbi:topoisomerase DNA-binding C4 zinc finger domain-containing protein [Acidobacteriota bacterium]
MSRLLGYNREDFLTFTKDILLLLDGDSPPPDPDNCSWCRYRKLTGQVFSEEAQNPLSPACPDCESLMRLKKEKYGEFWSCSRFPDCKGTRKV